MLQTYNGCFVSFFMITAGVDMARLFNHVLLQQTQPEDSQGAITITNMYTTWSVMIIAILTCETICLCIVFASWLSWQFLSYPYDFWLALLSCCS